MRKCALLVLAVVFGWSSGASAAPIEWTIASGGNGHFYEFIDAGSQIYWPEAKTAAEQHGGYLAVITSLEEDNWIIGNILSPNDPGFHVAGPWLGGYQDVTSPSYSEPAGGWTWVNGEAWSYSGWGGGEPSNGGGTENSLLYKTFTAFYWNDSDQDTGGVLSYIVEYEANPIPEPSTALLLGVGLAGLGMRRRRTRRIL